MTNLFSEYRRRAKKKKNDHQVMVVFLCIEATKKIFFGGCIKDSNSYIKL